MAMHRSKHDPINYQGDKGEDSGHHRNEGSEQEANAVASKGSQEAEEGNPTCYWVENESARKVMHGSGGAAGDLDAIGPFNNTHYIVPNAASRAYIVSSLQGAIAPVPKGESLARGSRDIDLEECDLVPNGSRHGDDEEHCEG